MKRVLISWKAILKMCAKEIVVQRFGWVENAIKRKDILLSQQLLKQPIRIM